MTSSVPTLVLTPAEIARWMEDCAEADRQVEQILKRKADTEKKLDAAHLLAPSLFEVTTQRVAAPGTVMKRKGLSTWPHIIEEHVRASGSGIRQKDMLEQLRAGPYASRFDGKNESGYYNAIQKVISRGSVIKRGEWLFTPAQHDAYMQRVAQGEVPDVAEHADYGSPVAAVAVRFITANPGAKSIDVIRAVWAAHDGPNKPGKTSLYNVLARLVEQEKIRKDEGGAFYPFNRNEAPPAVPGSASDAGEVSASPNDNRPTLRVVG